MPLSSLRSTIVACASSRLRRIASCPDSKALRSLRLGLVAGQPLEKIEREARRRVLFAQHLGLKRHLELGGIGAGDCGAMMVDPVDARPAVAQFRQMRAGRG